MLVTYIRKHVVKNRKLAVVGCRYHKSAHSHKRKQTHSFERNCFAAGVGACNNKCVKADSKLDICRHDLFGVDKRMSCIFKYYPAAVVHFWQRCFHFVGKMRLCKNNIKLGKYTVALTYNVRISAKLR